MKYLVLLVLPLLHACMSIAPEQDAARINYQSASQADRDYCDFEARKAAVSSNNRNDLVRALEVNEQRAAVFNSCLRYRQSSR